MLAINQTNIYQLNHSRIYDIALTNISYPGIIDFTGYTYDCLQEIKNVTYSSNALPPFVRILG